MKKSFTLIEILVVATIIGLLTASATVAYSQFAKQSRDARRQSDLQSIRAALEIYRSSEGVYPSLTFGGDLCDPAGCATATYMENVPNDPKTPNVYYYTNSSYDYTLGAYLEAGGSGSCGSCGSAICNYCLGPYGEK